ncbi:TetR/AcrR family transcriptional regulator [Cohnella nanjingensis]|uniref:TetR/AcrR family transcriptional regulator n=1 Tax=Cohnella nanjingensis TaxID=1387779 RepID=A0A7X0RL99_9BACL|nr:TetR/AcrR family transcriptional regulator [Cohnella nanjingensis]MBB6669530.1 TetR/AcrR family transcriptional regulator [Cohnella nanjingensis]
MNRRERHKQELRQRIIAATREIVAKDGWQGVTIRKVAEQIEYSPPTIYEYFENKDALLVPLLKDGYRLLHLDLSKAIADNRETPQSTLYAVAKAYWAFAFRERELYEIMLGLGGVPFGTQETPEEPMRVFYLLRDVVAACMREVPEDLDSEVDLFWSHLHGMISLTIQGRMKGGAARAEGLVDRIVALYVKAWG